MPRLNLPAGRIIRIVLDQSADTKDFDITKSELIHQPEFVQAAALIQTEIDAKQTSDDHPHIHHAITILGTRGSGKTSFLLSLKKKFQNDATIQVLRIIDPTLVEEKGHVFLNIIALITELVEEKLEKDESSANSGARFQRKEWHEKMQKLSAGLPSIDGIGKDITEGWQDPEFVMDSGLAAVRAAINLAKNLDDFLILSLKILQKNAFLLFFDDIDVDARKGAGVLETIRKYLTTRRLITVLSGDIKLYSAVIRQRKWQNFGKEILQYEGTVMSRMGKFNQMVTELTTQYLLKVMQPNFRIHLTTLLEMKNSDPKLSIQVITEENNLENAVRLQSRYQQIFGHFGVRNESQQEVYLTFMMSLPLRSQIQFLILINNYPTKRDFGNGALSDVFLADILEKEVNVNLANHTPKYLCSILLELLLRERKLNELYQLQPTTVDASLNSTLFSLWMLLSISIGNKNSFLIFDYFIKIAYIRNLMNVIPYIDQKEESQAIRPSIKGLCEAGDVFNDGVLRDVTYALQAYLYGSLSVNATRISPFFIQLTGLETFAKKGERDTIDVVFARAEKVTCMLAYIPCFSGTYAYKNESRILYSIYGLLATIGELVKQCEILPTDGKQVLIKDFLKQLSQLRSYPIPDFRDNETSSPPIINVVAQVDYTIPENLQSEEGSDNADITLAGMIINWVGTRQPAPVSAHLLGKIFTRFYYAMNNIANAVSQDRNIKLGQLFHFQVSVFMNAALIEDVIENIPGISLNINNTRLSNLIFKNNLQTVVKLDDESKSHLHLSKWLLSCPLLIAYLHPLLSEDFKEDLVRFCDDSIDPQSFLFGVSDLLDQVRTFSQDTAFRDRVRRLSGNRFRVVSGSPDLLGKPLQLIGLLKKNRIPRRWFQNTQDQEQMKYRYDSIKKYISSVFGDGVQADDNILTFKKYLRENRTAW